MKKLKVTILYDAVEDADKKEAEAAGEKVTPLVCEQVEQVLHVVKDTGTKSAEKDTETANIDDREFYVIEANPNPYLDKKSELAMAARKHELNYADLIEKIIELAMERKP